MTTTIAMPTRTIQYFFLFSILVILAACSPFQTSLERFKQDVASLRAAYPAATPDYLTEDIPPCTPIDGSTVDPCEPGVRLTMATGASLGSTNGEESDTPAGVRQFLDGDSLISVSHIVIRGTYISNTIRCVSGIPFRGPSYEELGYFHNTTLMQCFADVRVNAYILGSGPTELTVVVDFYHYWEGVSRQDTIDEITFLTELGFERGRYSTGSRFDTSTVGLGGREVILFVGPSHNHAVEAWQIFGMWDVQRQEDGTVTAVHPATEYWKQVRSDEYKTQRGALEIGLSTFITEVSNAHGARVTDYGGAIAPSDIDSKKEGADLPMLISDANRLSQFYTDTGAYDHPDGPPTQPSPVPACAQGNAVENTAASRALIRDCSALLDARDALAGTATLNWSADIAIGSWTGVTTTGTPERVASVSLSSSSLNGSIPDGLGDLSALTTLDLSSNQLTGAIPASLGELSDLSTLRLSGNAFSGCIPPALRDVTTNDLASVGLSYCDMLTPPPAPERGGSGTGGWCVHHQLGCGKRCGQIRGPAPAGQHRGRMDGIAGD